MGPGDAPGASEGRHLDNLIYSVAIWLVPLVVAIVFHELAHGYVANLLGDSTAADNGRLSLNPIGHVDPFGTVVLPMMLAIAHLPVFGWARPVPVNSRRLRNPRLDMVLVALAGPLMNLFLAALATLALGGLVWSQNDVPATGVLGFVTKNLFNFLMINVFLAVFNLLPLPPFDGGQVVKSLLPRSLAREYVRAERYALVVMLLLIVVLPMISPRLNVVARLVGPIADAITTMFLGGVNLAG